MARRDRSDALIYVAGTIAQRIGIFLILPVLLARLSVEEYGAFGLLQSLMSLLPPIITVNLPATVTRLYFDGNTSEERCGIAATLSLSSIAIASIASALTLFVVWQLKDWTGQVLALDADRGFLAVTLVFVGAIGSGQLQMAYGIWRAEKRPVAAAAINLANASIFLLSVFMLVQVGNLTLVSTLAAYAAAAASVGVTGSILSAPWFRAGRVNGGAVIVRHAIHYGLPMLPYLIGLWVLAAGGRWVARGVLDLHAVGLFTLASQLATVVGLVGRAAYEAWSPNSYALFAEGNVELAKAYLRRQGTRTVAAVAGIAVLAFFGAAVTLPLMAPQYSECLGILPIMLIAPVLDVAHLRYHNTLLGVKQTKVIGLYTTISIASFLGLAWAGTRLFGLVGLSLAYVGAYTLQWTMARVAAAHVVRSVAPRTKLNAAIP